MKTSLKSQRRYDLIAIITSVGACIGVSAFGQGTFQNLDFEEAAPVYLNPPNPNQEVTAASALPYWTITTGSTELGGITVNDPSTGSPWVSLVAPGNPFGKSIDGNYSVYLQGTGEAVSISQTGVIPNGTRSLLFKTAQGPMFQSGTLDIMIGSQAILCTEVGMGTNYTLYGANISAWAGESEQLTFSAPANSGGWVLDDISFSTNIVIPTILASGPDFGVQGNQFGFDIAGATNIPIVVEVCTNLARSAWVPLQSMTLTNGLVYFSEPLQTNNATRFYRITAP